jgi:hypothetical protein
MICHLPTARSWTPHKPPAPHKGAIRLNGELGPGELNRGDNVLNPYAESLVYEVGTASTGWTLFSVAIDGSDPFGLPGIQTLPVSGLSFSDFKIARVVVGG